MSDTFDKRAKAFEDKHVYENELHFKNKVAATKQLGAWAAERLGFDAQTTSDYTANLIDNCLIQGGLAAVIESVSQDFSEYGFSEDKNTVTHKIQTYLAQLDIEDGLNR